MEIVNEGSTCYVTVAFKDKNGDPAMPATVSWKAHDQASGVQLQAPTSVTPATSVEITVPAAVNAIHDSTKKVEVRVITVQATFSGAEASNDVFEYQLKNLSYV